MTRLLAILFCITALTSCSSKKNETLAFVGAQQIIGADTIFHTVPSFTLLNQNSDSISNSDLAGKVYVADFFFTTCPSICPIMTNSLVKVQRAFKGVENFALVSHTVNPDYDREDVLKEYAAKMHADTTNWHFLTGTKEAIYNTAFHGYFANAGEDELAPGGFLHSEYFILVDGHGRVRSGYDKQGNVKGVYEGTNDQDVLQLINDIKKLLKEKN
ncbi:MAG: SCO family protein [Flavobacteriales bacterium]|jgi:protein SCO1/2|tara:strand:+ start:470 stop:1114 length:645 start_codon:yes stop_codon:yes gene_type:complete